jgi:hypothetical protein
VQLHVHERFHLNNAELVGTIWEHARKERKGGFCSIWNLATWTRALH